MLKKRSKKIKIAIFISDVGFGHMVRQRVLIYKILILYPKCQITIYNKNNIEILKQTFKERIKYKKFFNNIEVIKTSDGFLNIQKTKNILKKWNINCENILKLKKELNDCNLILSDFVPEAFFLAQKLKINSFGICHFTWSWFFLKLGGSKKDIIFKLLNYELMANKIFLPPYTPKEIYETIPKNKITRINFIIEKKKIFLNKNKKPIFLIMDNGTKTLAKFISRSLKYLASSKKFIFYIGISSLGTKSREYINNQENLIPISGLKGIYAEIQRADYVIARAGFNTITECLLYKKPSIFLNELNNPEVDENIKNIYNNKLCAKMRLEDWGDKILKRLDYFIKYESQKIYRNLEATTFYDNGADQIIKHIRKILK